MTKEKRKAFAKAAIKYAFETTIGQTIFDTVAETENWAIQRLKESVKKATVYTIAVGPPFSQTTEAIHNVLLEYLLDDKRTIHLDNSEKLRSIYKPFRIITYHGTPILLLAPSNRSNEEKLQKKAVIFAPYNFKGFLGKYGASGSGDYDGDLSGAFHPDPTPIITATQRRKSDFVLMVANTKEHKKNLKLFFKNVVQKKAKEKMNGDKNAFIQLNGFQSTMMRKRSMETVFMNSSTKENLINSIDAFVNRKDWYEKNFVPYHYGILLYGPPGTGKSTLIRALITEYIEKYKNNVNSPLYLKNVGDLPGVRNEAYEMSMKPRMIVIEDIDAASLQKREDKIFDDKKKGPAVEVSEISYEDDESDYIRRSFGKINVSLSEVLNTIDGVSNLENVIYIFTTNHIDHLDPALIRPGRIDKMIHIDRPGRNEYDQFMFYHFGKHIPDDMKVNTDLLIAELQNEIVCEKTYDEVLEILRKEN